MIIIVFVLNSFDNCIAQSASVLSLKSEGSHHWTQSQKDSFDAVFSANNSGVFFTVRFRAGLIQPVCLGRYSALNVSLWMMFSTRISFDLFVFDRRRNVWASNASQADDLILRRSLNRYVKQIWITFSPILYSRKFVFGCHFIVYSNAL